jgi:transcriptional regulator with XRE-family HTH domain
MMEGGYYLNQIKLLRKEKGMTQTDLAKAIGVEHSAVSKWEIGSTKPEPQYIERLAEFFDVDKDYILGVIQDERTQKADLQEGALKVYEEIRSGAKEEGAFVEFMYQLSTLGLPKPYYGILMEYRRNDDFKRMITLWQKMSYGQRMEWLGYGSGIAGKFTEMEDIGDEGN